MTYVLNEEMLVFYPLPVWFLLQAERKLIYHSDYYVMTILPIRLSHILACELDPQDILTRLSMTVLFSCNLYDNIRLVFDCWHCLPSLPVLNWSAITLRHVRPRSHGHHRQ